MTDEQRTQTTDKVIIAMVATLVLGVVLYFALGMPGMNHGSDASMDGMGMSSSTPVHRLVDPDEFAVSIDQPGAVVINVHVPYEGEIAGTHLFMQFDEIDPAQLPEDRNTPLVVYCRSGTMSATAVVTLAGLGYTNIVELAGGMKAWDAAGRTVAMTGAPGG